MRKVLSIIVLIAIVLTVSVSIADVDISGLSYEELVALQKNITKEIMSRPEWKEVEVPSGQYTTGIDVPVGEYSIRPKNANDTVYFRYYPKNGEDHYNYYRITDKMGKFNFFEGMRFYIEGTAIFAPPISLGF